MGEVAQVFPASAGMILHPFRFVSERDGVPRIRGDDPLCSVSARLTAACSPHSRG